VVLVEFTLVAFISDGTGEAIAEQTHARMMNKKNPPLAMPERSGCFVRISERLMALLSLFVCFE
jgi:hypothetical protein